MRKINLFLVLITIMTTAAFFLYSSPQDPQATGEEEKVTKKYFLTKATVYQEESLVIDETDLNCIYFIRNKMNEDLYVTGGVHMDWKKVYGDHDRLFINKGTSEGINDGDMYMILGVGKPIDNGVTHKNLGTLYLRRAIAEITCAYENNAILTVRTTCHPIRIGDILVPYKKGNTLRMKKLKYLDCRLPKSPIEGNVAYINWFEEIERSQVGSDYYVTVDLGKAMLSVGDWLLIYKIYGRGLPPIIIGSGIVVHTENTNSTVKVIDSSIIIEVGNKVVLFREAGAADTPAEQEMKKDEELPLQPMKKDGDIGEGKEVLEMNILFDIDNIAIKDIYKQEIGKVREFIDSKTAYDIILRGYSCSIGGMEHNLRLSQKRVEAVKKYLMETLNLKEEVFETYQYGEKEAPYDNTTEEQRRKNRLVNVQVIEK